MNKKVTLLILLVFVLQCGYLAFEQRAFDQDVLRRRDDVERNLTAAGLTPDQARAVGFEIWAAQWKVESLVWRVGQSAFISTFALICIVAGMKSDKKSHTGGEA